MTRRFQVLTAASLLIAVAAAMAIWFRLSVESTQPPMIESKNLDPAIAKVIEENRKQVLRSSKSATAWGKLAMVLYTHDFTEEANLCFREAERFDQKDPRWPYFQGVDLIKNDPAAAVPKLKTAVVLAGKVTTPRLRLAKVLTELGQFEEAEANLRAVEQIESKNPWVQLGLGRLYFERGQTKESLSALEVPATDPETRKAARSMRLSIYTQLGDEAAAKAEIVELSQLPDDLPMPDPWAREMNRTMVGLKSMLAQINQLLASGRGNEAAQLLVQTVERYPKSEEAWRFAGQLLLKTNDLKNAEAAWRHVLEFSPDSVVGHYNFGVTLFRKGQYANAAESFLRATQLKPDHGMAYYFLGKCFEKERAYVKAIAALRQASRCQPQSIEIHVALAEAIAREGKQDEAVASLVRALQLRPNDESLLALLKKMREGTNSKP